MSPARTARLWWWASTPLLPTLAIQGTLVRRRVPLLPEAAGARSGITGAGRSLSLAVIGESTAAGVGVDAQEDALGAKLAGALAELRAAEVRWQVVGRTGLTIAKARRELLPELKGPVDLVVAVFGVNDALKLTSERTWRRAASALVDDLVARGTRHVLFTAAPPLDTFRMLPNPLRTVLGVRTRLLNALLAEVVRDHAHASTASFEGVDPAAHLSQDGFHPSAVGYEKWARLLAAQVTRYLK